MTTNTACDAKLIRSADKTASFHCDRRTEKAMDKFTEAYRLAITYDANINNAETDDRIPVNVGLCVDNSCVVGASTDSSEAELVELNSKDKELDASLTSTHMCVCMRCRTGLKTQSDAAELKSSASAAIEHGHM